MEIKVEVRGQKLKTETNSKTYVSGTQEFVKFVFTFIDNSWDGLTISAQFRQGDTAISFDNVVNNSVYLPPEMAEGECLLTLYGVSGNIIAISDSLKLKINENSIVTNPESTKLTSSFYNKLVEEYQFSTLKTNAKTIVGAINELYDAIQKL